MERDEKIRLTRRLIDHVDNDSTDYADDLLRVPFSVFNDAELAAKERDVVRRFPHIVAHVDELPKTGYGERRIPVLGGRVGDVGPVADPAGVVDHRVQTAEAGGGLLNRCGDIVFVGHVGVDVDRAVAESGRDGHGALVIDVGHHHSHASGCQQAAGGCADPAGAAGHHGDLSVESVHGVGPFRECSVVFDLEELI